MFTSIWEDLQREFRQGNMITRIILVNLGVYVFVNLVYIFFGLSSGGEDYTVYEKVVQWLSLSSDWWKILTRPWTIISSMFLHEGFWHILWNMLFLYWFGRIVGDLIGDRRILPIYVLGGLIGGLFYFASVNLLPYGGGGEHYALGASGAVMAIVMAAGVLAPDYIMRLILIGDVKLKYIVAVLIFIDLVGTGGKINTGGHFAHLGGAAFGWFFVYQLRNGTDLTEPLNRFFNMMEDYFRSFGSKAPKSRVTARKKRRPKFTVIRGNAASDDDLPDMSHQERLDVILEKIKQSGYESLNSEEKEFLFNASNK